MIMKQFKGSDLKNTLDKVKTELGSEAIITNVEKIKQKGKFSLKGKNIWQITAAVDNQKNQNQNINIGNKNMESINRFMSLNTLKLEKLEHELVDMKKSFLNKMSKSGYGLSNELQLIYDYLSYRGLSEKNINDLIDELEKEVNLDKLNDEDFMLRYLIIKISEKLNIKLPFDLKSEKDKPEIMTLIGPTGVGKTTTIAKLAANFSLVHKKKVGLITLDTYRICGYEQLKTFGDLLNIKVYPVLNHNELKEAIDQNYDKDIILVDTVGRSQYNIEEISKIKLILFKNNMKKSLVINANMNQREMLKTYENYSKVGFDNIILTKIDETLHLGDIYNLLMDTKIDVSFVTFGQKVPEDIMAAEKIKLASKIIGTREDINNARSSNFA